jgi:hypothetical protein
MAAALKVLTGTRTSGRGREVEGLECLAHWEVSENASQKHRLLEIATPQQALEEWIVWKEGCHARFHLAKGVHLTGLALAHPAPWAVRVAHEQQCPPIPSASSTWYTFQPLHLAVLAGANAASLKVSAAGRCYDTIGKTCATLQQLLYHRTITISFEISSTRS